MASHFAVTFPQATAVAVGRCQHHDRVQLAIQPALIAAPRAVGQIVAPPRQHDRPQQQRLHARSENRIARLDSVFAVAQLVRQTNLPDIGMALLRTVEVGDPNVRPVTGHRLGDHAGGAAVAHDVDHHLIVLKYPIPMGPPVDAHRGLVGADDPRAAQPGKNGCDLMVETGLGTLQHRIQRAFADLERIEVAEQLRQAAVADRVGEAQVNRQRQDVHAERRAALQARRDRCQGDTAAAWTMSGIALYPGHQRAHDRQVDFVIPAVQHLIGLCQRGLAMRAAGCRRTFAFLLVGAMTALRVAQISTGDFAPSA